MNVWLERMKGINNREKSDARVRKRLLPNIVTPDFEKYIIKPEDNNIVTIRKIEIKSGEMAFEKSIGGLVRIKAPTKVDGIPND